MTLDAHALASCCAGAAAARAARIAELTARLQSVARALTSGDAEGELQAEVARLRGELQDARTQHEAATERLRAVRLEQETVASTAGSVAARLQRECDALARTLPDPALLETAGWVEWIERWHVSRRIPHDPPGLLRPLEERGAVAEVARLVAACVETDAVIQHKHADSAVTRGRIAEADADVERLTAAASAVLTRLAPHAGADPLRIVEDLPQPNSAAAAGPRAAEVQRELEHVLTYFERVLGGYAVSAALESQMLDHHLWDSSDGVR